MAIPESMLHMVFIEHLKSTPKEVEDLLVAGEQIIAAFKSIRDYGAITNKRIIYFDKQGILGSKVEIYSIPFSSIIMFSSENSGKLFDVTTELQLWTKIGEMKMSFPRKFDVHGIIKVMSEYIL